MIIKLLKRFSQAPLSLYRAWFYTMAGCTLLDRLLNMAERPSSTHDGIYLQKTCAPHWCGGARVMLEAIIFIIKHQHLKDI